MGIARKRNLCLSNFTVLTDPRRSTVTYQLKPSTANEFHQTQRKLLGERTKEHLDLLLSFRPLYRTDSSGKAEPEARSKEEQD